MRLGTDGFRTNINYGSFEVTIFNIIDVGPLFW